MNNHSITPIRFFVEKKYPESVEEVSKYTIQKIDLIFSAKNSLTKVHNSYYIQLELKNVGGFSITNENMEAFKVIGDTLYKYQAPSKTEFNQREKEKLNLFKKPKK
jgi:hypothetical protein